MRRSTSFVAAGLLLAAAASAQAQTSADFGLRMDSGFYIAAGAGKARTSIDCSGGPCDLTDNSWNVSAGYQFNRHFAAEIGYVDLGETVTTAAFAGGGPVTAVTEAKAFELLGVAMLPLTDRFSFYLKGGLYRSEAKSVSPGMGFGIGSGKENDTGFTFGGGVQYAITPNFGARFEWQNYNDVGTGVVGYPQSDFTVWRVGARFKF